MQAQYFLEQSQHVWVSTLLEILHRIHAVTVQTLYRRLTFQPFLRFYIVTML